MMNFAGTEQIVVKTELLLAHIGLLSGWLLIGLAFTDDSELSSSLGGALRLRISLNFRAVSRRWFFAQFLAQFVPQIGQFLRSDTLQNLILATGCVLIGLSVWTYLNLWLPKAGKMGDIAKGLRTMNVVLLLGAFRSAFLDYNSWILLLKIMNLYYKCRRLGVFVVHRAVVLL